MSDFTTSAESPAVGVGPGRKAAPSSIGSGSGNWGTAAAMDQITVVRIDDTHIAEERSHDAGKGKATAAACYEMEYSVPEEVEEEEEDGVYVIEYSNPEEEGESYQFTMSVDRSLPAKKPAAPENARAPSPTGKLSGGRQRRKRLVEEDEVEVEEEEEEAVKRRKQQQLASNQRILELGEDYTPAALGPDGPELVCTLCPPPGRSFQRASGLAVHMKHMHLLEANKTFFCTMCEQPVRSQVELDAHTKRHANRRAVFTCLLCAAAAGAAAPTVYRGSRLGLKRHLTQVHPGVVPRCDVCRKGFSSLASYLADQFRHVAVSPYFCPRCQIYEMTERGLIVHMRNDEKKQKKEEEKKLQEEEKNKLQEEKKMLQEEEKLLRESGGNGPQTLGGADNGDNSATDDSDF
ncbi:zinc finger and BTB domain-containing protein 14-like [Clinocottus analis]|uniref:zinc finger and BTB domain-containing protein 14-like n=1 Tax=Clinocottus analis TaxID=304258 RepID=UPI0035C220F4